METWRAAASATASKPAKYTWKNDDDDAITSTDYYGGSVADAPHAIVDPTI